MKKSFPWVDFLFFGGFALLSLVCTLIALLLGVSTAGGVALLASTGAFLLIFAIGMLIWYYSRPDFITCQGVAVWAGGIEGITIDKMEAVLNIYMAYMSANTRPGILKDVCIEWKDSKVGAVGIGWSVIDREGLQSGKNILLHWLGSYSASALVHELHHLVAEFNGMEPDYKHVNITWWALADAINEAVQREGY